MKISVVTPTYNRAKFLGDLYNSLTSNSQYADCEWIVIDDGSHDITEELINNFKKDNKICIKYFKQSNQGKMAAINNYINEASGDLIIECDSDDYLTDDAFEKIIDSYEKYKDKNIYALCFHKYLNNKISGNSFKVDYTTMFDLYFKLGEIGEEALVFIAEIRKKFKYELEQNEKFVTEARMFHKMDEQYGIVCVDEPIMYCEYKEDGYSKNIKEQFIKYPFGYYHYFKEILQKDFKKVSFNKRLYSIKHYILFTTLTNSKKNLSSIKNISNKLLYIILYIPGKIKTKSEFYF